MCYILFTSNQRRLRFRRFRGLEATELAGAELVEPGVWDSVLFGRLADFFATGFPPERWGRFLAVVFFRGPRACRAASLRLAAAF